ncbi:MAG: hypothetical protein CL920_17775 [Deltaproteobacteria bacterium]|nr:hypothetical protein [Deltaproteobacteria bacterium]
MSLLQLFVLFLAENLPVVQHMGKIITLILWIRSCHTFKRNHTDMVCFHRQERPNTTTTAHLYDRDGLLFFLEEEAQMNKQKHVRMFLGVCIAAMGLLPGCKSVQTKLPSKPVLSKPPHKEKIAIQSVTPPKPSATMLPGVKVDDGIQWSVAPGPSDAQVLQVRRKMAMMASKTFKHRRVRCGRFMRFRSDCSGWVRCMFSRYGLDLMRPPGDQRGNGVLLIRKFIGAYGTLHRSRTPALGDVVFWHYTYDKDRNGKLDDYWTHIGIVERIESDGRISILHYNRKVKRLYMDLRQPNKRYHVKIKRSAKYTRACSRYKRRYRLCKRRRGWRRCRSLYRRKRRICRRARKRIYIPVNDYLVGPRKRGRIHGMLTGQLFAGFGTILQTPLPSHLAQPRREVLSASDVLPRPLPLLSAAPFAELSSWPKPYTSRPLVASARTTSTFSH